MTPSQQMMVAVLSSSSVTAIVVKLVEVLVRWIERKKNKGISKMATDIVEIKKDIADMVVEIKELKESNIVILHDKIYRLFESLDPQDSIDVADKVNLDYIFERYKASGGNHRAEVMYNKITSKPVVNHSGIYQAYERNKI